LNFRNARISARYGLAASARQHFSISGFYLGVPEDRFLDLLRDELF
jgi:hypothetical protein